MPCFETFDAGSMAASGIKSLLDFGFAQLGSAIDSKRAFKYWNRQRDRIITEARAAYNLQRADALKDTLQQYQLDVAAKKNAGLNPALGEGQGAVTMSQPDINAQDNGAIQSSSGQVTFNPLLQAQLENIRADTQEKLKSAGLKGSQIDLNKQIFDQNLEKWPIVKRILGNEDLLKEIEVKQGYLGLKKFRKELKILDETLKQSKVTTDNMTKDNQVKAVEVYLRVMRTIADYYKTVEEIGEVRSKTSLNYASASNQRAQAWLAPYQARNLVSGEALNYAKVKTEGTQQQLNGMLYKEAGERMKSKSNPDDRISRADYQALSAEQQSDYKGIRTREVRALFNIEQTTLPMVDKTSYEKVVQDYGRLEDRVDVAAASEEIRHRVENMLANAGQYMVEIRSDSSGVAHYDSTKDVIFLPEVSSYENYEDYARDAVSLLVSATGHQQRLAREGMGVKNGKTSPEDAETQERLIVEVATAVKLQELGISAKLSPESLKMTDYWSRELRENPCLVDIVERDVNNAVDMLHKAERGEKVELNSQVAAASLSPMLKQFYDLKAKHPDAILLFRCGDFYETYCNDAEKDSKILGITLTRSNRTKDIEGKPLSMAGFPYHALDTYLPKLIRAGERVAICDQLEAPKRNHESTENQVVESARQEENKSSGRHR